MTIKEALASPTPSLGMFSKIINNGDDIVIALITETLTDLNSFFNLPDNGYMTPSQIQETAKMIFKDYNALKIEDIRVCFGNGKKGHYGQLYARIDGQIIMMWLSQYSTDRTNEYLRIRDFNEKQALNKKIAPEEINPEGQKKVIEMLKEAIKPVEVPKAEKPVREKTQTEKLIQRFYRQFTKIALHRNYDDSYRFIFQYGRVINANEYVEIKLKQHERLSNLKQ